MLSIFGWGRSARFTRDQFTSEPLGVNHAMTALSNELSIENHAISNQLYPVSLRRSRRVGKRDREPSRLPVRILKCLRNKSRKLNEFVQVYRSLPSFTVM